jgi:hypothetical protein
METVTGQGQSECKRSTLDEQEDVLGQEEKAGFALAMRVEHMVNLIPCSSCACNIFGFKFVPCFGRTIC